ncbi:MAG: YjbQ family protein [Candidatus Bathyarchaeota archaeon]|nr:MAG: YjbQ family protein [Candidatus Bathyarchaeota archaeon]
MKTLTVFTKQLKLTTKGEEDIVNITSSIAKTVSQSKCTNGTVTVFVTGSTGSLTTLEYETGLLQDFSTILARIAPKNIVYDHNKKWHDGNGHSHIRASILGPSITIPVINNQLTLGRWQQIVFIEHDVRSRTRTLIIQIIGESD